MASLGLADLTSRTKKMAKKVFKKDKPGGGKKNPFGAKADDDKKDEPKKKGGAMYDNPRSMRE